MDMRNKKGQFIKGTHWRKPQLFRNKEWLKNEYVKMGRSAEDIAKQFCVTSAAILFWMKRHGMKRRTISEARKLKHWGCSGIDNPMWNRCGELNPRWLGGITPERQKFYISMEWKKACSFVWKRDRAICRRCGLDHRKNADMPFHIHHIRSFKIKELRANVDNLILVCEACHDFIHSKRNIKNEYIPGKRNT